MHNTGVHNGILKGYVHFHIVSIDIKQSNIIGCLFELFVTCQQGSQPFLRSMITRNV